MSVGHEALFLRPLFPSRSDQLYSGGTVQELEFCGHRRGASVVSFYALENDVL
jgi:hypothetical protein